MQSEHGSFLSGLCQNQGATPKDSVALSLLKTSEETPKETPEEALEETPEES